MGQYYIAIILGEKTGDKETIRTYVHPYGAKLMEHSFHNNTSVAYVEWLLSPEGPFYRSRLTWAGDYADNEPGEDRNLYHIALEQKKKVGIYEPDDSSEYFYIVNHSRRQYVDKNNVLTEVHPLPILTAEGNGRGGGDYEGTQMDLVGSWSGEVISMEARVPDGYDLLDVNFQEGRV